MAELTVEYVLQNVRRLLNLIGNEGICKGCLTKVWWIKHKNGKTVAYTETGLNHFADCPARDQFKKPFPPKESAKIPPCDNPNCPVGCPDSHCIGVAE